MLEDKIRTLGIFLVSLLALGTTLLFHDVVIGFLLAGLSYPIMNALAKNIYRK